MNRLKTQIPESRPRYSQANFRRFEAVLLEITSPKFSHETYKITSRVAPTSWVELFRAACQAYLHETCTWPSRVIKQDLYNIWPSLRLAPNNASGTVHVSLSEEIDFPHEPLQLKTTSYNVTDDPELLNTLLVIKHRELTKEPIQITGVTLEDLKPHLEYFTNVTAASDQPGVITIF